MRKMVALALIAVVLVGLATPAQACGSACGVAIGLASFFFLSALVAPFAYPYPYTYPAYAYPYAYPPYAYPAPAVYQSPVTYQAPVYQQQVAAPAPMVVRVVQYPHGRYELRGDGVTTPYEWVWVVTASGLVSVTAAPGSTQ